MQIFLINLNRRNDRLDAMTAQLARLGLAATRIPAIDADEISADWLAQFFRAHGPLGVIPKGDQCCSLSHRRAWTAFLASGAPYATVLEDDVVLSDAAAHLLRRTDWIAGGASVVKLEHFGPDGQRVLVGEQTDIGAGHSIAPILSRHTGAAAYVISRAAAMRLSAIKVWDVPVDHLMFNPNVSPLAQELKPFQLLPAIARQSADASDIKHWRLADRRLNIKLVRREIVRAYYECRLLPRQIAAVLAGAARLKRVAGPLPVRFDQLPRPHPELASARTATV
jgi:glycosyl transferase, family 25